MRRAFAALAVTLATLLPACTKHGHAPLTETAPVAVEVTTAHEETLPILYRTSGTVRGRNTAILTSKTSGYVRAVHVRPGDQVTLGQPLVDLEANDVRAGVTQARAGLDQAVESKAEAENALVAARANAALAKSSYERVKKLFDERAIPEQQYDDAEARARAAEADRQVAESRVRRVGSRIDEAKAVLGESQVMLGYAGISAPFAGRVLERRVDPGVLATPGTPLLVLADEGTLRVETAVEESRANDVKIGDTATIEVAALPASVVGTVSEIVPNVDVASRAFTVKIDLPADAGPVHAGTFARVGFDTGTRSRLVVPKTAISTYGALDRVFVVENGHARIRMITRGNSSGPWTEILSGLASGEAVVASPPPSLRDGEPVEARR